MPVYSRLSATRDADHAAASPRRSLDGWRIGAVGAAATVLCIMAHTASADSVVPCTAATCTWSIAVGGTTVESGTYGINSNTGALSLNPITWAANGATASLTLNGNTRSRTRLQFLGRHFGRRGQHLLPDPVDADRPHRSDRGGFLGVVQLTSTSSVGAEVQPLFGKVVTAQEVSTVVGGRRRLTRVWTWATLFPFPADRRRKIPRLHRGEYVHARLRKSI